MDILFKREGARTGAQATEAVESQHSRLSPHIRSLQLLLHLAARTERPTSSAKAQSHKGKLEDSKLEGGMASHLARAARKLCSGGGR